MAAMELVAGALAAGLVGGLTGGLTETGQRAARSAWNGLMSLVSRRRRDATAGEEESAPDAGEGSEPVNEPDRGVPAGKCGVFVNRSRGVAFGDHISQTNYFTDR
ncbi:hypothetical protein ACFRI7_01975 [Streptomyces sp. NPDC056716]|uniref:hypothetical protein n=1 Tax=unclassified Streptomyces TaxID=2593676 RepID=UPI003694B984